MTEKRFQNEFGVRCKHDLGWCAIENQLVYTDREDKVRIGFVFDDEWIQMRCNYIGCSATRQAKLIGKVSVFRRIKYGKP